MKVVRVPLRISFVGGGSDIPSHYEKHSGAVVSVAINRYIYITVKPASRLFNHKNRLVYSTVEETQTTAGIQHPIIRECLNYHGITEGVDLDVMSDIPAGTGMGSSSAFTVGLHAAFSARTRSKAELAELASFTEIEMLKEPIGKQDQYAAAFGSLNHIVFEKTCVTVTNLAKASPSSADILASHLHLLYVGKTRSASAILEDQQKRDNSTFLNEMASLADEFADKIRTGSIHECGSIIREGWELKKSLSPLVSSEFIDSVIKTAFANGATGGKLLGAGGTGFILLCCEPENRNRMLESVLKFGLRYVPVNFDFEGCKVLYED